MRWTERLATKITAITMTIVGIPLLAASLLLRSLPENPLIVVVFSALFVLFLGLVIWMLTRRLTLPLDAAINAAEALAHGKLDFEINANGSGEAGRIARSLRSLADYLREISGIADKIAAGQLNVEIQTRSAEDRFGAAFQNMLKRTLRLVQTQDERDRLQNSIMKLLEEVADVASGDLTAEAEVTADATGAIADAFNYMIDELRGVIGRVKETGENVNASAAKVQKTTQTLVRRSETQSTQLGGISVSLDDLAGVMQEISREITMSAQISDSALMSAQHGTGAVKNNIAAMNRLRSRVQETADRIKRLGDRSQEISAIVKIINDLAQRTSVLALNASIQATAAGAAGRGFVAVAEEVERLAERSASASKQIDVLTKAIQGETNDAVIAMETTVKEVAVGVKLTGEVGTALGEIEIVAQQLAGISQTAAVAARSQSQTSTDISAVMRGVANDSQQTVTEIKESAAAVNQLATWANDLRGSVASFRLPETDASAVPAVPAPAISINSNAAVTV